MTGATLGHSAIASNLDFALRDRLRGGSCRAFRGDVKIIVAEHVRYPDLVVTCSPAPLTTDIVPAPVVAFEVLSPSTARTDRTAKNKEYRATASIQHYAMLEQSGAAATVFSRTGEDWIGRIMIGMEAVLGLPAIGVDVPLAEIYAGIELAGDGTGD